MSATETHSLMTLLGTVLMMTCTFLAFAQWMICLMILARELKARPGTTGGPYLIAIRTVAIKRSKNLGILLSILGFAVFLAACADWPLADTVNEPYQTRDLIGGGVRIFVSIAVAMILFGDMRLAAEQHRITERQE